MSDGGGVVIVGTASGKLHCISCPTGEQLWEAQTGQGISTAAAFCPVSQPCDWTNSLGPAYSPSVPTAPDDSSQPLPTTRTRQTHKHAVADPLPPTDIPLLPQTDMFAVEPTSMGFSRTLFSCTNQGAVRVLRLSSLSEEVSQAGQQAATGVAEEVTRQCAPVVGAAVQMPGTHASACC